MVKNEQDDLKVSMLQDYSSKMNTTKTEYNKQISQIVQNLEAKHEELQIEISNVNKNVFQRRIDGKTSFDRNWIEHKEGFGDPQKEYWLERLSLHIRMKCLIPREKNSFHNAKQEVSKIDYNKQVRPIHDQTDAVLVTVSLQVTSIHEIDEAAEKLVVSGFLDIYWVDENLVWDIADYNDIDSITILQVSSPLLHVSN
ncbi:unnamed protein product [Mytilus coruscus]|uniref:Uncharacterized protein n=1 Tax=Mytilus coruscus TaxID=42192 RepID=A0A6J8BCV2_MYTCO|nr:unnamed protein product [Mytilus coruscus]